MPSDPLAEVERRVADAPHLVQAVRQARQTLGAVGTTTLPGLVSTEFDPVSLDPSELPADDTTAEAAPLPTLGPARYDDLGPIGSGGMGEVRRVRDRELNRVLAMKLVRADLLAKPTGLARFVQEAQATAQLQHPSIVPVHDVGRLADGRGLLHDEGGEGPHVHHVHRGGPRGPC